MDNLTRAIAEGRRRSAPLTLLLSLSSRPGCASVLGRTFDGSVCKFQIAQSNVVHAGPLRLHESHLELAAESASSVEGEVSVRAIFDPYVLVTNYGADSSSKLYELPPSGSSHCFTADGIFCTLAPMTDAIGTRRLAFTSLAAFAAFGAGFCALALLATQAVLRSEEAPPAHVLLAGFNLLLIPVALYFWFRLGPDLSLTIATAAGVGSLLLWAVHSSVQPMGELEPIWIWLSAIWWLGLGVELRLLHRKLGVFTSLVGLAALLDGIVSTPALNPPFIVFALLGGWKIPLSFAWALAVGVTLVRFRR